MIGLIAAFIIAMALSVTGTPILIRFLVMHQYGQFIRQDGPTQHLTKRGTPTMGGVVIILATVVAWLIGSVVAGAGPSWSGLASSTTALRSCVSVLSACTPPVRSSDR